MDEDRISMLCGSSRIRLVLEAVIGHMVIRLRTTLSPIHDANSG